jgi:hypothetical protein
MYTVPPWYLMQKEASIEENVETGIKSPGPETMRQCRELTTNLVSMSTTMPTPKEGYYKEGWVFNAGATVQNTNNNWYMFNLRPTKQKITVVNGKVYPVQRKGEVVLQNIC